MLTTPFDTILTPICAELYVGKSNPEFEGKKYRDIASSEQKAFLNSIMAEISNMHGNSSGVTDESKNIFCKCKNNKQ